MIASKRSSHSRFMKWNSKRWVAASLWCVGCFTDVGVGTRDDGNHGGEGADHSETGGTDASSRGGGGSPSGAGGTITQGTGNVSNTGQGGTTTNGTPNAGGTGALAGTAGGAAGGSGLTSGTGGTSSAPACLTSLKATEASNYSVSSTFSLDVASVKPTPDLTVDWSALTTDFRGRPIEGIDMLELALWPLDLSTFEQELSDDTLENPIVITYLLPDAGATSANLLDLRVPDGPLSADVLAPYFSVENYPPANHVYTLMLANGTELGKGTRMLKAFRLDPASNDTDVVLDSTSTQITASANLHSLAPHRVPASTPNIVIDWTNMRVTGAGNDFVPSSITRVDVAKFSASVSELEAGFFRLDELAKEHYTASVELGTKFDLALTRDGDTPFPGIDASGTWLLVLSCGFCQNPAPWYLTVLEPCAP